MRKPSTNIAVAAGILLAASMLPSAAAEATPTDRNTIGVATPGKVSFSSPLWQARPGKHATTVRVRYPTDVPPANWDGQPVDIQVRRPGGTWKTAGTADQQPVPGRPASRTRVEYTSPIHGDLQIRAKAHSKNSFLASAATKIVVTPRKPAYDPTALSGTSGECSDPAIGRNASRVSYACLDSGEYGYNTWLHDAKAGNRNRLNSFTNYPDLATNAEVAIGHSVVDSNQDLDTYRARRYNLKTGKSRWIAYKRNGKRAHEAIDASVSANGKRIAYSSNTPGISPKAPKKGRHVYFVPRSAKKSRYLGNGALSEISASGRYVVWRNPRGKIKSYDLRKNRSLSITKREGGKRSAPDVSAAGRYVTYSEKRKGNRVVRFHDRRTGRSRTIAKGSAPALSDNGRYVAYRGADGLELYVWDRKKRTSELITVGPSGDGSGARVRVPAISPNGRWIVAATWSAAVAPDNGRGQARNSIVLFDRKRG